MQNIPKRHHYIPELILKNFTNEKGKLFTYNQNAPENGIFETSVENVFVGKHLYSIIEKDGSKDTSLESDFAELEGYTKPIVNKIIENARKKRTPNLSAEEKEIWNKYYYYQLKRVPDFYKKVITNNSIRSSIEETIQNIEKEVGPLPSTQKDFMNDEKEIERIKKETIVKSISQSGIVVPDILNRKGVAVALIVKPNKSFIIGSLPIVQLTNSLEYNLNDPLSETWFPISHDVIITSAPEKPREKLYLIVKDEPIRYINNVIMNQSRVIAGRSKKLIYSLINSR